MPTFDELIQEAEAKNQIEDSNSSQAQPQPTQIEDSNNSQAQPQPTQIETNGAERAQEINEPQQDIPAENQQSTGLFGKLKNAFWISPEDKQQKEMAKMKSEEEKLNSQLLFQKKKTDIANKKAQIAKIAQQRRANSPIGQTFSKIGKFVQKHGQQNSQVRNPLEDFGRNAQSGLGSPNMQRDIYGQNAGINFGLVGRPAPAPQSKPMPIKRGKKSAMYKKQAQQAPTYQTQQPYGNGMMNSNLLNEFGPRAPPDPFANTQQSKPKPRKDLGLMSGRW